MARIKRCTPFPAAQPCLKVTIKTVLVSSRKPRQTSRPNLPRAVAIRLLGIPVRKPQTPLLLSQSGACTYESGRRDLNPRGNIEHASAIILPTVANRPHPVSAFATRERESCVPSTCSAIPVAPFATCRSIFATENRRTSRVTSASSPVDGSPRFERTGTNNVLDSELRAAFAPFRGAGVQTGTCRATPHPATACNRSISQASA